MSIELWFAMAATATALLLVPHPLALTIATFRISWGAASAALTVPAFVLALAVISAIASIVFVVLATLPALATLASWAGIAYLMLHVLYAFQDPRLRHGLAANDNLPQTRPLRILGTFLLVALKQTRYIALVAALAAQFWLPEVPLEQQAAGLLAATTAGALVAGLVYTASPRLFFGKRRRAHSAGQVPHKPKTLFIASRAVTAGYRRIAA